MQIVRLLMTGVWACIVTVGESLAISYWKEGHPALAPKQEYTDGLAYEKTRVINVPMIADGSVQGYVVTQLAFTADAKMLRQLPVSPEGYVVAEAFRNVYGDEKIDFKNPALRPHAFRADGEGARQQTSSGRRCAGRARSGLQLCLEGSDSPLGRDFRSSSPVSHILPRIDRIVAEMVAQFLA